MDWDTMVKFVEIILIPMIGFLWKRIEKSESEMKDLKREMHEYEVRSAEKYATVESVLRLESKIDELKDLIIKGVLDGRNNRTQRS